MPTVTPVDRTVVDPDTLLQMASGLARTAEAWTCRLAAHPTARTGLRILATESYDVWLLRWPAGTAVSPHDHGSSDAAFTVAAGSLTELRWDGGRRSERVLARGDGATVPRGIIHDVAAGDGEALSVHVYSPPLAKMSFFDDLGRTVVFEEEVDVEDDLFGGQGGGTAGSPAAGLDALMEAARRRISPRASAAELLPAMDAGALVVDIRPSEQRGRDGEIDGALIIDRNVLEWRLDPTGTHRLDVASDPDRPVIVVCNEGYASSLAAAALLDIGRRNVTDLDGGFQAFKRRLSTEGFAQPSAEPSRA